MRKLRVDWLIVLYGALIVAALVVSAPATYRVVAAYHSDGSVVGIASTVALLFILEAGAVMAKLATLWTPRNHAALLAFTLGALGVNTLSNWIYGGLTAAANGLHWIAAWAGALLYAAMLPGLIYLLLHLIVERVGELRGVAHTVGEEVGRILMPVTHAVEVARQASQSLAQLQPLAQLPDPQASYPRAEAVATPAARQPVLTPQTACPICGQAATKMQLRTAKQHSGWRCACGVKVTNSAL